MTEEEGRPPEGGTCSSIHPMTEELQFPQLPPTQHAGAAPPPPSPPAPPAGVSSFSLHRVELRHDPPPLGKRQERNGGLFELPRIEGMLSYACRRCERGGADPQSAPPPPTHEPLPRSSAAP